jgi:hypothetical protein
MPVFEHQHQLRDRLDYYLTDETARTRRAEEVRKQIEPHTYKHRMESLLTQLALTGTRSSSSRTSIHLTSCRPVWSIFTRPKVETG